MIDDELVETLVCIRDEYCAKYTAYDSLSKHCMSNCPSNGKGCVFNEYEEIKDILDSIQEIRKCD